jgi:hypothetical protein
VVNPLFPTLLRQEEELVVGVHEEAETNRLPLGLPTPAFPALAVHELDELLLGKLSPLRGVPLHAREKGAQFVEEKAVGLVGEDELKGGHVGVARHLWFGKGEMLKEGLGLL